MRRYPLPLAILAGGGIAGAFDLLFVAAHAAVHGVPALRIFQSIASGLLGPAAFENGAGSAALGILLHFLITGLMAAAYCLAATRIGLLLRRPLLCGAVYGLVLYVVMKRVVLPLSAYPFPVHIGPRALFLADLAAHLGVGLIIAYAARWARRSSVT